MAADDDAFVENVRILFNNDMDNSTGWGAGKDLHYAEFNTGKVIETGGTKARYIRLYSNGNFHNEYNYYTEVEVYGF